MQGSLGQIEVDVRVCPWVINYTRDADQLLSSPFVQNQFLSAHLQRPSAVASMPRKL